MKERNMRWQWSSRKHLYIELPGCTVRLKEGKDFMLHVFSLVRYLKGLLSVVLHLNTELVLATSV